MSATVDALALEVARRRAAVDARKESNLEREVRLDREAMSPAERAAALQMAEVMRRAEPGTNYDAAIVASPEYRDSYLRTLRGSETSVDREVLAWGEWRDQSSLTGSAGLYTIPQGFHAELAASLTASTAVRQVAKVLTTSSGSKMPYPVSDDTAQKASLLNENYTSFDNGQTDPVYSAVNLYTYPFIASVKLPIALVRDSGLDILAVLAEQLGDRIARGTAGYYYSGSGSSQPLGYNSVSNVTTTAANNAITMADLASCWFSLSAAYRGPNARWLMHPTVASVVRQIKDSSNRPLFPAEGPLSIFGAPVVEDDYAASYANGAILATVGDWQRGYVVRDCPVATMFLRERYADYSQVGVLAVLRTDSSTLDGKALAQLKNHS